MCELVGLKGTVLWMNNFLIKLFFPPAAFAYFEKIGRK